MARIYLSVPLPGPFRFSQTVWRSNRRGTVARRRRSSPGLFTTFLAVILVVALLPIFATAWVWRKTAGRSVAIRLASSAATLFVLGAVWIAFSSSN